MTNYTIKNNEQFNSKEVYFDGKPNEETRRALKALKFRWHKVKSCWYGFATEEQINEAINPAPLTIPKIKQIDGYGLYDGWKGGNADKWRSYEELKTFLLSDFRKAGIKATIRQNRAGYLTSITITMKITADEILTFEEWLKNEKSVEGFHIVNNSWYNYTDENGRIQSIFGERFYNLTAEEQAEMRNNIAKETYREALEHMTQPNTWSGRKFSALNEAAAARLSLAQKIVDSYNHDQTNSMIDYFDRDIYEHFAVKVAA